jgi:hypothetical protein
VVEQYLQRLHARLVQELPEDRAREIVLETESHLRERVAALEELGQSEAEAEQACLSEFGCMERYSHSLIDAHSPSRASKDGVIAMWAAVTLSLATLPYLAGILLQISTGVWWWLIGAVGLVLASFRLRRFAPSPIIAVVLLGFLFVTGIEALTVIPRTDSIVTSRMSHLEYRRYNPEAVVAASTQRLRALQSEVAAGSEAQRRATIAKQQRLREEAAGWIRARSAWADANLAERAIAIVRLNVAGLPPTIGVLVLLNLLGAACGHAAWRRRLLRWRRHGRAG